MCRVCARDTRRVVPSPTGLAQGDNLFVPGFALRAQPCPTPRWSAGHDSAHKRLDGVSDALCILPPRLRDCAPSPLRQYARADAYPGLRAFASLSLARSVGLVKLKSIRPFPSEELRRLAAGKYAVIVPELNRVGWLAKEIKATVDDPRRVIGAPRVFGGMTMPAHLIVDEIRRVLQ